MKWIPAAAACLLLASGCGSSGVKTTCSTDVMGMKMQISFGAKSETDAVDNLEVRFEIPRNLLSLAGIGDSDEEIKQYVKDNLGEDVDESSISIQSKDDTVIVSAKAGEDVFGGSSGMSYEDALDMVKKQQMFTCE